ncbi:MAG: hypothetical protein R3296_12690 [Oleiphilaceae bacterium]|nr:hypothetical protein [Oleiphilaceae bacterium]
MTPVSEWYGQWRYLGNRLIRHLFSLYRWVVMVRTIEPGAVAGHFQTPAGEALHLRQATRNDYPALIEAYPAEFSGHLTGSLKARLLMSRADSGIPCFIAINEAGRLCGATWCPPRQDPMLVMALGEQASDRAFEMMNTFVTPDCRSQGIGRVLRRYALDAMARQGYRCVVSYIWYSRPQSLAMNFATGSTLLGEKRQVSLLGWRKRFYSHRVDLSRIGFPALPPLLILAPAGSQRRSLAQCFRRWGIRVRAMDLSTGSGAARCQRMLEQGPHDRPVLLCCDEPQRHLAEALTRGAAMTPVFMESGDLAGEQRLSGPGDTPRWHEHWLTLEQRGQGVLGYWYLSQLGLANQITLWKNTDGTAS